MKQTTHESPSVNSARPRPVGLGARRSGPQHTPGGMATKRRANQRPKSSTPPLVFTRRVAVFSAESAAKRRPRPRVLSECCVQWALERLANRPDPSARRIQVEAGLLEATNHRCFQQRTLSTRGKPLERTRLPPRWRLPQESSATTRSAHHAERHSPKPLCPIDPKVQLEQTVHGKELGGASHKVRYLSTNKGNR